MTEQKRGLLTERGEVAVADILLFFVIDARARVAGVVRIYRRIFVQIDEVMRRGQVVIVERPTVGEPARRADVAAENVREALGAALTAETRPEHGFYAALQNAFHLHGIARRENEDHVFVRGDGFFQAAHLLICQIIAAFDGHIVPVFGGTARDEEERRLRAVSERKARLFHGFGNGERPARLDQARARLGDAEVFIVAVKRHALALFQRQDAVVLQKYDAFVRNALGGEFVFLMSAVVRARRGRFDLEGHGGELAPAFALVAAQLDRVSLTEFVRLLSHGQKEDGQGGLE